MTAANTAWRIALPVAALAAACEPSVDPKLSEIQTKIFDLNCTTSSCHGDLGGKSKLVLEPGKSFAALVNAEPTKEGARTRGLKRVVPGDPEHSLLWLKLQPSVEVELGARMPDDNADLYSTEKQAIYDWIKYGAKDD